jgi:hypothetical protein
VSIFDLVFILTFLGTAVAVIVIAIALARGRPRQAGRIAARLSVALGLYFVIVLATGLATPQRYVALHETRCSDDWCIAVDSVRRDKAAGAAAYTVVFALSSRARRVAQRERFVVAYLLTDDGRRIDPLPATSEVPFDTLLQPGQTIVALRRFAVPPPAHDVGLVIAREGGLRFPGCCIIGDESSFLHKQSMVRLD